MVYIPVYLRGKGEKIGGRVADEALWPNSEMRQTDCIGYECESKPTHVLLT